MTNSLYHYYALMTGRAVTQTRRRVRYVDTTMHCRPEETAKLLQKRNRDMFCLNDGSFPEVPAEERAARGHRLPGAATSRSAHRGRRPAEASTDAASAGA